MIARRLLPLTLVASLALAACGGGDDSPSKDEFAKDANKICQDLEKAVSSLRAQDAKSLDQLSDVAGKLKSETDDATKRLDDLETPSGDAGEKAQRFVDSVKANAAELTGALGDIQKAAEAKDQKALGAAVQKLDQINTDDVDRLAKEAGVNGCAD